MHEEKVKEKRMAWINRFENENLSKAFNTIFIINFSHFLYQVSKFLTSIDNRDFAETENRTKSLLKS